MSSVIFEDKKYFYKWEEGTQFLYIYDSRMCNLKNIKATNFNQESKTMQEAVVLAMIEAVTKIQKADELLEGIF